MWNRHLSLHVNPGLEFFEEVPGTYCKPEAKHMILLGDVFSFSLVLICWVVTARFGTLPVHVCEAGLAHEVQLSAQPLGASLRAEVLVQGYP